jgi:hypothetical protein
MTFHCFCSFAYFVQCFFFCKVGTVLIYTYHSCSFVIAIVIIIHKLLHFVSFANCSPSWQHHKTMEIGVVKFFCMCFC